MAYAIKIRTSDPNAAPQYVRGLAEYTTKGNSDVLLFETQGEAEVYAQNLELSNYDVVTFSRESESQ